MQALRNHQKIIFLCTTVLVVASFLFFGTYSATLAFGGSKKSTKTYSLIDGRATSLDKLQAMKEFISTSSQDVQLSSDLAVVNILNEGVIEKEFLATNLGRHIFSYFQDSTARSTLGCYQKAASYKNLFHPSEPSVSLEKAFSYHEPAVVDLLARLHQKQKPTPADAFSILSELCLKQRKVSIRALRSTMMDALQKKGLTKEHTSIETSSMLLCGCSTIKDWLGEEYIDLCAQIILQMASYAKAHGVKISDGMAKKALLSSLQVQVKNITGREPQPQDLHQIYLRQLHILKMDEALCLSVYKDILAFTSLMQNASIYVKNTEQKLAEKKAKAMHYMEIERYDLPKVFEKMSLASMLKLQMYLEMLAPSIYKKDPLAAFDVLPSASDVEKRFPELVCRNFTVAFASVSKKEILCQIPMKKIIEWQLDEKHWPVVVSTFTELGTLPAKDSQQRLEAIESMSPAHKIALDKLAQEALLQEDATLARKFVAAAAKKNVIVEVDAKGRQQLIPESNTKLLHLLSTAALVTETSPSAEAIAAAKALECYSIGDDRFYFLQVISRDASKRVLTFEEVEKKELLDVPLFKKLEIAYVEAIRRDPASFDKSASYAQEQGRIELSVAKAAFPELFRAIEQCYTKHFSTLISDEKKESTNFYITFRPLAYAILARDASDKQNQQSSYCIQEGSRGYQTLWQRQWLFTAKPQRISLIDRGDLVAAKAVDLEEGSVSDVVLTTKGSLAFFKVLQRKIADSLPEDEMEKIRAQLAIEARRELSLSLLERLRQQKLVYPQVTEDTAL